MMSDYLQQLRDILQKFRSFVKDRIHAEQTEKSQFGHRKQTNYHTVFLLKSARGAH